MTPTTQNSKTQLFLIDTSSLIFRAFYAIRNLTSPDGTPVNALYGVLSMILKLIQNHQPQHLIFCYDSKEKGERYQVYPNYKANRGAMPEELIPQMSLIKEAIELLGFNAFESTGIEADDLIGTLAKQAEALGWEVVIVSGDKDFAQLLSEQIKMYDTMKETWIGPAEAKQKWEIFPYQMIDFLALVGDSSDNVPGVRGIGPKRAVQLLQQFETLDGIYQHLDSITGNVKVSLIENREMAYLSQKLVTIQLDVKTPFDLTQLKQPQPQADRLVSFFDRYNLKTLKQNYQKHFGLETSTLPVTETTNPLVNVSVALSLSKVEHIDYEQLVDIKWNPDLPIWIIDADPYLLLSQDPAVSGYALDYLSLSKTPTHLFKLPLAGFEIKNLLHRLKPTQFNIAWDSALAAYLLDPGQKLDFTTLYDKYISQPKPDILNPEWILSAQAQLATHLKTLILPYLSIYQNMELPLIQILYRMETLGIKIDTDWLIEEHGRLFTEITELELKIHQACQKQFSINSPKQLAQVLFEDLKLPVVKKTKTGYSTDSEVLEELKGQHPIIEWLLEYRELTKLKSTYVNPLPQLADQMGRIHTTFQQMSTTTGRLSSIQPNLQNIPIRTPRGERLRQAFIAETPQKLATFDYSQIELRILAHYCEDPTLMRAFHHDLDIHTATASEVFELPIDQVTAQQRRLAKAVNFGILYGQSAFGLASTLSLSRTEAQDIINRYFARFPNIKNYVTQTIELAKDQGYVETLFGRRRYLKELQSKNKTIQKFGERAAINAPLQGTAADIVKLAMIKVPQEDSVKLLLQVHDELIFEGSEPDLLRLTPVIKSTMESIVNLKVPLKVNFGIGNNWSEAH